MATRRITGDLHTFLDNAPAAGAILVVKLVKSFATSTHTYDAGSIIEVAASDGTIDVVLAVPDDGTALYEFALPSKKKFKAALAAGPATTLEQLFNAAAGATTPQNVVLAAIEAALEPVNERIDTIEQIGGLGPYPGHGDYPSASIPDTLTSLIDRKAEKTEITVPDLVLWFENQLV